jgi:hypothetical protein
MDRHMQFARAQDLARQASTIDAAAPFAVRTVPVGTGDATREERVAVVGASYLQFFDAAPALGRLVQRTGRHAAGRRPGCGIES